MDKAAHGARWHTERGFVWIGNFRRLVVRHENKISVYRGFLHIARMLIGVGMPLK